MDVLQFAAVLDQEIADRRAALVIDRDGKIYGRAIVWPSVVATMKTPSGSMSVPAPLPAPFLDRLYVVSPRVSKTFYEYAKAKGCSMTGPEDPDILRLNVLA